MKTNEMVINATEKSTIYGYVRVSTREQNEARQVDAMKKFGVDRMLIEKQSGKDFDRPVYIRLLKDLKPGDVLVVKSIDRWAGTTPTFSTSGVLSRGKSRLLSLSSICPCWIRDPTVT